MNTSIFGIKISAKYEYKDIIWLIWVFVFIKKYDTNMNIIRLEYDHKYYSGWIWKQIWFALNMNTNIKPNTNKTKCEYKWYSVLKYNANMNTSIFGIKISAKYEYKNIIWLIWVFIFIKKYERNMNIIWLEYEYKYYNLNCNYSSTTIIIIANCFYCAIVPLISVGQSVKGIVW